MRRSRLGVAEQEEALVHNKLFWEEVVVVVVVVWEEG
jgi:hypothetical protein